MTDMRTEGQRYKQDKQPVGLAFFRPIALPIAGHLALHLLEIFFLVHTWFVLAENTIKNALDRN
jgi:hypothetical protein